MSGRFATDRSQQHALDGRIWWPLVKRTVASVDGGARTDVFPSLHTAGPSFLTVYSFRHRRSAPFRYTWPPLAFSATQIIVATMFLRWHYLIDIVAGMTLAITAALVSYRLEPWETRHREQNDLPPVFGRLLPAGREPAGG